MKFVESLDMDTPIYTVHENCISTARHCEKFPDFYLDVFIKMRSPLLIINQLKKLEAPFRGPLSIRLNTSQRDLQLLLLSLEANVGCWLSRQSKLYSLSFLPDSIFPPGVPDTTLIYINSRKGRYWWKGKKVIESCLLPRKLTQNRLGYPLLPLSRPLFPRVSIRNNECRASSYGSAVKRVVQSYGMYTEIRFFTLLQ